MAMTSSAQTQRQAMASAEAAGLAQIGPCPSQLDEIWIDIPLPNSQTNRTKVVRPKPSGEQQQPLHCPLVIYYHGGGLSVGSPDSVLAPARAFASLFSCVVACPTLDQLPELGFPATVRNAWEVCAWLSDVRNLNEGVLKDGGTIVDPGRGFVVGGLSSGGATAAVIGAISGFDEDSAGIEEFAGITSLRSAITGIFSGIPFLATESMLPPQYRKIFKSREENSEATADALRLELESALGVHSPWFSPINLDIPNRQTLQNHPPKVYIYGGQLDPFRDDSIIYAKWLEQLDGVQVRSTVLEGEGHNAWVTPPFPASHTWRIKEPTIDGMGWLLGLEWDRGQELPF
ncbi:alpha/beta-hydrolase [Aspergillus granulosus]|uniref:Alpha/beta-hydrolase n=1 Tax=Aspergillus granulosus TaxID=176169 RepID=A0ABR4HAI0_9EURO